MHLHELYFFRSSCRTLADQFYHTPVTIGHVCISVTRAAGGIFIPLLSHV
jgi:hypothetical protein